MRSDLRTAKKRVALTLFVTAVLGAGAGVIVHSALTTRASSLNLAVFVLAVLTIVSGRISIKIPGRSASVSISEVFVFASILLFGGAVSALIVAVDGLWISLRQRDRKLYRAFFNIAEPAISTWMAAQVFFAIARVTPGAPLSASMSVVVPATFAMGVVFFVLNSGLSAVAVALESGRSAYEFWRGHAWYLAINTYAAASLAALAVSNGPRINFGVAGLVIPLLLLSYVAYREATSRIDDAQHHVADVERLYRASVEMLAIAVDAKDQITHGHIRRVQRYTLSVAAALGVNDSLDIKAIEAGALLHDIGKVAIPDYVLDKPSALTAAEFNIMKTHASMGARILTAVEFPYPIVPIVRHHHERWDGRGYPDGLAGTEIPLGARILAVVDCFDALTSDRPYRPRLTDEQAIEILRSREGTFYDPAIVKQFIDLIPELRRDDAALGDHVPVRETASAALTRVGPDDASDARGHVPTDALIAVSADVAELIDEHMSYIGSADGCLFVVNDAQDALVIAHATRRIRASVTRCHVPLGSGVSGWVAANRSAIRRANPVLDLGELADAFALKWCVSVPVFVGANLFGVLTMYVADATLTEQHADALGVLAQEVGLSIARGDSPLGHVHPGRTALVPVAVAS
jgi:putative nucleotidyltransferase with HDIG domain